MKWKTDLPSIGRIYPCTVLLLLLLAAHLPFLTADPDLHISFSRGPFTDEGLNTVQVRNWVNHGYLDLTECDNLLKTPLLGFPLALTYTIFGSSLAVSRLHVLLILTALMWIICLDRKQRTFLAIFTAITLLQYEVFHFSHFSLAEMLSAACAIMSIHFLARSSDLQFSRKERRNFAIVSGIFISLSYFIKIQFIYLVFLIPVMQALSLIKSTPVHKRMVFRQGYYTSATILSFLLVYLLGWYLPNKEAYDMIMAGQSGEFSISYKSLEYLRFNLQHYIFSGWFTIFTVIFLAGVAAGFRLLLNNPSSRYPTLFLASLTWVLLELHKLLMVYLPTRYRISLYVAMGLLVSIVAAEVLLRKKKGHSDLVLSFVKGGAWLAISIMLIINIYHYFASLERRSFVIREANRYIASTLKPGETALGAWAPSLTRDSRARAIPVWNNFLNYRDPVNTFRPRVIISETDEQDSEQAYLSQGIHLPELADSSKTFRIGQWDVAVYWVNYLYPF